jgi:hypothetical protein
MRKGFQENDLGFCLTATIAFPAIAAGIFGLDGACPNIGEKQNAHRGHQDHNEQPEVYVWPSAGRPAVCLDTAFHTRELCLIGRNYTFFCYSRTKKCTLPNR